jgi:hypothetical protein
VLAGVAGVAAALLWLRLTPPLYSASMTVAPLAERGLAGMGARLPPPYAEAEGRLTLPGQEESLTDFRRFVAMLTSRPVAAALAADPEVLRRAFPEAWDAGADEGAGAWRPPDGVGHRLRRLVASAAGRPTWSRPGVEDLARHLGERLMIEPVGATPLRRVSYRHEDRAFALALLGRLYAAADGRLRAEASRRGAAQVDHVRARLAQVTQAEHRHSLAEMLAGYERVLLLLEVDLPFAADLIEEPHAAALPDAPDPFLLPPAAGTAGAGLGFLALRALAAWRGGGGRGGGRGRGGAGTRVRDARA